MAKLPSGRNVAITPDLMFEHLETSNFMTWMSLQLEPMSPAQMAGYFDVIEFRTPLVDPPTTADEAGPRTYCGFGVAEVMTEKCSWSQEDKAAFMHWLSSKPTQDWILEQYGEFEKILAQGPGQVHHSVLNQLGASDPADLGRKMLDS
ncbi:hypothetical protein [Chitinilyticum piscinae]|uniref:Uncharacterized protein n=1 Tax=Chitinilyticum piscinae TaxID=2866724 RepID=A0A8J7G2J9_9NEIS|nr:hypothetical protein [Chitinilyticum piscinae]MBE9610850.1 hypothetical protein [Chitinilyticum piscinae]